MSAVPWSKLSNLFLWLWIGCTVVELAARRLAGEESRRDLDATLRAVEDLDPDHIEEAAS